METPQKGGNPPGGSTSANSVVRTVSFLHRSQKIGCKRHASLNNSGQSTFLKIISFLLHYLWSFLILFQQYFVCDYAINVECNNAESFYALNANFGQVTSDADDSSLVEEA